MVLDTRIVLENKTKFSEETIKQVFWESFINEQRPTLKI